MTTFKIQDLIERAVPRHDIVSTSNPEPRLRAHNVVATYRSTDEARNAVLALESMEPDDAAIGVTVVAPAGEHAEDDRQDRPVDDIDQPGVDPEGVVEELTPRTVTGAIVGAVVGAVLIGGGAAIVEPEIWPGALIGGALFGSFVGAVWGAFSRMGGSDAYRQTFVRPSSSVTVVSMHTDDPQRAVEARNRLALQSDTEPLVVHDRNGRLTLEE